MATQFAYPVSELAVAVVSGRPSTIDAAAERLISCGITDLVECCTWTELPGVMQRRQIGLVAADVDLGHFGSSAAFLRPEQLLWFAAPVAIEVMDHSVLLTSDPPERWREELEQLMPAGVTSKSAASTRNSGQSNSKDGPKHLPLKMRGGGIRVVEIPAIIFAQSSVHGCDVYLSNEQIVPSYQSLHEIELMLAARNSSRTVRARRHFVRAGHVLVNLAFVAAVTLKRKEYVIEFASGVSVPVPRRKHAVMVSSSVMGYWGSSDLRRSAIPEAKTS